MWEGEVLKAFLPRHRFDIVLITVGNWIKNIPRSSGVARSSDGLVNVSWVVLHCNRRIGARERRQLIPHVRFQVPFLWPESQVKSGFACVGLLCNSTRRRDDDFKSHSDRICWFETMRDRGLYHTKTVPADHFRETLRGLKAFINIQVEPSWVGHGVATSCGCCGAPAWGARKQALFSPTHWEPRQVLRPHWPGWHLREVVNAAG